MEAHRKKIRADLRSVWDEWSAPHDWGLWQDNPKPTVVQDLAAAAGAPEAPDVGADAGGAVEVIGTPAPKGHHEGGHSESHSKGSKEEEEEEGGGGGGGSKGGGGGGKVKVPGYPGFTPSKKVLKLAEKVHQGIASKESLIDQLKSVRFAGQQIGEKAVALATALAKSFDSAVVSIGKVAAPRAKSVPPAKRAESKPKAATEGQAPKAPPAPKGSPAAAPAAAKKLGEGVVEKTDKLGRPYYMRSGKRISKEEAYT